MTKYGLYEWNVMPFGLTNAPSTFQRMMDIILAGLKWKCCLVYLDDVNVYSGDFDQHLRDLEDVFERLSETGLKLNWKKCRFCSESLIYLGHRITSKGILPDESKLEAIKNIQVPKSVPKLRSMLGLVAYYKRFIPGFSQRAAPLFKLLRKNEPYEWTAACQGAFEELKSKLMEQPLLIYPDFERPFLVQTDASNDGLGAILSQESEGVERVVSYASRALSKAEKNYSATEKECLAVVWAVKHFRPYLHGQKFELQTDHRALQWLMTLKEPNERLMRWALRLQEFEMKITYRPGVQNQNADALSRLVAVIKKKPKDDTDDDYVDIRNYLEHGRTPEGWDEAKVDKLKEKAKDYHFLDGSLFVRQGKGGKFRRIVGDDEKESLLALVHGSNMGGHLGVSKTVKKITQRYFWKGISKDVREFIKRCEICQRYDDKTLQPELQPLGVKEPFGRLGIDTIGILPSTTNGNRYIVVAIDYLTKWVEARAIPDKATDTIVQFLIDEIICRHGCPREILSDQGTEY